MQRSKDRSGRGRPRRGARAVRGQRLRERLMAALEAARGPRTLAELERDLKAGGAQDRQALRELLERLTHEGVLVRNRRDGYGLARRMELITGRVHAHPDGFGFLIPDDGGPDLFLSPGQMRMVLHGDRVVARIRGVDRRGRPEGFIVEVLERANHQVVGRLVADSGVTFVVPDNKRITHDVLIPPDGIDGARPGQIVVAALTAQPELHRQPVGRVVEVLGEHMAPGLEVEVAIRAWELPHEWPDDVLDAVREVPGQVRRGDRRGRLDLRDVPLVTIDGADARDFDDAVWCERQDDGWRLLVAIADVSHYVRPGSPLDLEAERRGNSVYFPNRVLPMLPPELSNGICSLNPDVERLCMVCEMTIDRRGRLTGYRFHDAVMRSHARLTYDTVAAIVVERDRATRRAHRPLLAHLDELYRLYRALHRSRVRRGALDFDSTETRIEFDEQGKIAQVVPVVRNDAHRLIEECMIAANVAAADFLGETELPAVYRVHDRPAAEKVEELRSFLAELGLELRGGAEPEPRHFMQVLAEAAERPDRHLVQTVVMRTLKLARYAVDNVGHFGLALDAYTHFTSPIRRYPDLLVHRAIRGSRKRRLRQWYPYPREEVDRMVDHCSLTERRADEATRDVVAWLKAEYMRDRVGETLPGIVTSVVPFGLFIELEDVYVEGLAHISTLPRDYYQFDAQRHQLVGERSGRRYRLGDAVMVQVARVDLDQRQIDFAVVEPEPAATPGEGARRRGGRRRRR